MKSFSYIATSCTLVVLSAISVIFTLWAGNHPGETFHIMAILPWLPWTSAPYIALAALLHVSRRSIRAANIVLICSLVVGCLNIFLMSTAYVEEDRSGELWLAVPLYELLACVPLFVAVILVKNSTTKKTPKAL